MVAKMVATLIEDARPLQFFPWRPAALTLILLTDSITLYFQNRGQNLRSRRESF